MSAAAAGRGAPRGEGRSGVLVALGLAAMYLPSYWDAAHGLWQTDDFAHGPIVLAVVVWLFWQVREVLVAAPWQSATALGWPLFVAGLLLYVFGRTFTISSAEFLSQLLVVAGLIALFKGGTGLRAAWFPIFYLIFMVPPPGSVVDALTGPLKHWISVLVVDALYSVGYPITRTGVMLTIGQYQLLVADACSGLHSMFSLGALGTLFMYLMARTSRLHNAIMLVSILPIAFLANIVRVALLVLVTYHLGDEAGQGFLHGAAGIVLMLAALICLLALDAILLRVAAARRDATPVS